MQVRILPAAPSFQSLSIKVEQLIDIEQAKERYLQGLPVDFTSVSEGQ